MAPALDPQAEKLRHIHSIPALVKYLDEELGWPVHIDDWEDAVYDWQPQELNLKAEHEVAVRSIKQLRPLVSGQPWGIFFVDFEKGKLPITVLRRMLNGLAIKSRAKDGSHQTWHASDLLFVSSFGNEGTREIALAHFTDESTLGDMPTLRVLGWDEADTPLELGHVARTLKEKLRWPAATSGKADQGAWRAQWSGAFSLKYRQVINDSKTLALALAELAKRIRSRVNAVLALENDHGHLRQLHKAFKDNLITDLSADGFADMYAQTITYGLFAARASKSSGSLVADDAALMASSTNPFLRDLLQDFLQAGGRARRQSQRVDFDELGINEVVTTLREVPMDAVLRSFNSAKPGDDPVIHFYEDFLKAYDQKMRAKRGVFYTPRPVVQFIVRSVDEILKTEFGIEDGLASTITWGEVRQRRPELALPDHCTDSTPFVQILDPATGTATFIVEVIEHIHAHMLGKWNAEGLVTRVQWLPRWNDYVRLHLLPRLYAFELMMAPYAIAHMKIGIKLAETGYSFPEGGPRVNVFLTNALEPAHPVQSQLETMAPMLAHEARAANRVKEQLCATAIIGNPPYAGHSANNNLPSIVSAVHQYKRGYPDLQKPGQGKWLQNDYVKFIRFSELRILQGGIGVLGFITDHSYLDNPTFKGMRRHLRNSFPFLRIVDLHGNSKKKETAPDGSKDESVFGILQGTAVGLFARGTSDSSELCLDILGTEASKAEAMLRISLQTETLVPLAPNEPLWLFRPQAQAGRGEYESGWSLPAIFSPNGDPAPGIVTTHDEFAISWNEEDAISKVEALLATQSEQEARELFQLCTQDQWNYDTAKSELANSSWRNKVVPILYRPFDSRTTIYDSNVAVHRRDRVMGHLLSGSNVAIVVGKAGQVIDNNTWTLISVTRQITDFNFFRRGGNCPFPLWIQSGSTRLPNIGELFLESLLSALGPAEPIDHSEAQTTSLVVPKVLNYTYALLHSPVYRHRYAAFLKTDFPRIPIPASRGVFDALAALGEHLIAWHLLEHPSAAAITLTSPPGPTWFGNQRELTKVAEKGKSLADEANGTGKVFVNATSGFTGVNTSVWQHTIGGYQVLHKWLDDRRKASRSLSDDDITHWLRVYAALEATQVLMQQVDAAIEAHGGWPGAFSQNHPPPDAATLAAEQQAQKERLKAQKKAAKAGGKKAMPTSPTGATSLFDDLADLADAAGDPSRPKAKATPAAKAAGGKANQDLRQTTGRASKAAPPLNIEDISDAQLMCALRAVLASAGPLARADLLRHTARHLGFARMGTRIHKALDDAVRRAVRRGIAENADGLLSLVAKGIDGYDREFLKQHLLGVVSGPWWDKADVPQRFARYLGFARVGPKLEETAWSLMRSLVRSGLVEVEGRGAAARYRKNKVQK